MAIPISFTYEQFADYLQLEVLRDSADTLGWGDTVKAKVSEYNGAVPAVARVRNTNYNFVTDETLRQMGLVDITQINSTNIKLFRLIGRVEILKKAMQTMSGNYTYSSNTGVGNTRQQAYQQVTRLFQIEQQRLFTVLAQGSFVPSSSVPEEADSTSNRIRVVW